MPPRMPVDRQANAVRPRQVRSDLLRRVGSPGASVRGRRTSGAPPPGRALRDGPRHHRPRARGARCPRLRGPAEALPAAEQPAVRRSRARSSPSARWPATCRTADCERRRGPAGPQRGARCGRAAPAGHLDHHGRRGALPSGHRARSLVIGALGRPGRRALRRGQDHAPATVDTLVLASVGASVPVVLVVGDDGISAGGARRRARAASRRARILRDRAVPRRSSSSRCAPPDRPSAARPGPPRS